MALKLRILTVEQQFKSKTISKSLPYRHCLLKTKTFTRNKCKRISRTHARSEVQYLLIFTNNNRCYISADHTAWWSCPSHTVTHLSNQPVSTSALYGRRCTSSSQAEEEGVDYSSKWIMDGGGVGHNPMDQDSSKMSGRVLKRTYVQTRALSPAAQDLYFVGIRSRNFLFR